MKRVSDSLDWEDCEKEDDWSVAWIDGRMIDPAWYENLRPMQRVNHFPGIEQLARKKDLGRHLNSMRERFPADYAFYPQTWLLPEEYVPDGIECCLFIVPACLKCVVVSL